jgi:hypothetical protein
VLVSYRASDCAPARARARASQLAFARAVIRQKFSKVSP